MKTAERSHKEREKMQHNRFIRRVLCTGECANLSDPMSVIAAVGDSLSL